MSWELHTPNLKYAEKIIEEYKLLERPVDEYLKWPNFKQEIFEKVTIALLQRGGCRQAMYTWESR